MHSSHAVRRSSILWSGLLTLVGLSMSAPLSVLAGDAPFRDLKGTQIAATVSGRYVTDDHHWGHHYLADGRVMLQESGRERLGGWSVRHDQLCLLKPQISKTEPQCYTVQRQGSELRYVDDRRQVVYQGFVRGRANARLFDNTQEH